MKAAHLWQLVLRDLRRNLDHFLISGVGIVLGIATFVFFLALGFGVREVVLGKIFPIDRLEVVPRALEVDVGPLRMGLGPDVLDDDAVASIASLGGVESVSPKMRLTVPSVARGGADLFGSELKAEIVADGIDPRLVRADIDGPHEFRDFEDPGDPRNAASGSTCTEDSGCPQDMYCLRGPDEREGSCRAPIPVVISHHLAELYNGGLRRSHGFPSLNPDAAVGFTFELAVGESLVAGSRREEVSRHKAMIVGFSDKAIPIGMTIPIQYVQRLNVAYGKPEAAKRYHSAVVEVTSKDEVTQVSQRIDELGFDIRNSGARQAGLLIAILMGVFGAVAISIVLIAALNIMHVFFMLVYQRQREIGIMRAIGASRRDVRQLLLVQAALVGLVAGIGGGCLAVLASLGFDAVSANLIPNFPYKPETYFVFTPGLFAAAVAFAVGFCVLGAALPARKAARTDPAVVLVGR